MEGRLGWLLIDWLLIAVEAMMGWLLIDWLLALIVEVGLLLLGLLLIDVEAVEITAGLVLMTLLNVAEDFTGSFAGCSFGLVCPAVMVCFGTEERFLMAL